MEEANAQIPSYSSILCLKINRALESCTKNFRVFLYIYKYVKQRRVFASHAGFPDGVPHYAALYLVAEVFVLNLQQKQLNQYHSYDPIIYSERLFINIRDMIIGGVDPVSIIQTVNMNHSHIQSYWACAE